MEQKMAPGTGLTARQEQFLAVVQEDPFILKHFYLTGGTALSSWYLHHRESYDLDFFSDSVLNKDQLTHWLTEHKAVIGFDSARIEDDFGFLMFFLSYKNRESLKIDFHHYGADRLKKGLDWRGLSIDSFYDIAVNKLQTIVTNPRGRDYVDLFGILGETKWSIRPLMLDARKKFNIGIDVMQIAKSFLKVGEYTDLPSMLIPFDRQQMDSFFMNLAKSFKQDVFT